MNTTPEDRAMIVELAFKSAFKSAVETLPFGKILTEVVFEYRSKVKEKRLFNFIENLKTYVAEKNPYINIDTLKSDEFGDLFENILRKVTQTRQDNKVLGFRNILLKGIAASEDIEYCELFTELLSQIHEKQIKILFTHSEALSKKDISLKKMHRLSNELFEKEREEEKLKDTDNLEVSKRVARLKNEITSLREAIQASKNIRTGAYYGISEDEYQYLIQDLYNKALMADEGVGAIGTLPFEIMHITELGMKFLEFVVKGPLE